MTSKNEPTQRHVKHEDEGASPKMAKRLEDMLRRNLEPTTADSPPPVDERAGQRLKSQRWEGGND